jgi:phosphoglycerate kinase
MEPRSPSLFLLGGAKFSTKLPLVTKYLDTYSGVFIGGALANDLLRARGYPVGQSMMSDVADAMLAFKDHPSLLLPVDVVVSTERDGASRRTCGLAEVEPDEMILDAGPKTIAMLRPHITTAQTILWNGPLGNYEDGYTEGTEALAATIAESRADSIVGGGDTVAAIEQLNINTKFTHVSTGGGAMLALLESGTLPALEPLRT